mmetsp:Transcript_130380/g.291699  ORF Transcript_130380/g.291699 Transcript_130380/m.291699 type:complete len:332 (-) Transcript_130380:96-1091(-)
MIGRDGQVALLMEALDDVQVRHPRLHHEDVRALLLVKLGLQERLAVVGWILLVSLLAIGHLPIRRWETRVRIQGFPEGAIECGGVLGAVRHDPDLCVTCSIQSVTDGADAAVHHVAGAHIICTRLRLRHRLLTQVVDRLVVEDHSIGADDAVMAEGIVGIQRDVCVHDHVGVGALYVADGALSEALGVEALLGCGRLELVGCLWEDHNGLDAQLTRDPHFTQKASVHPKARDTGHRGNRDVIRTLMHKHRQDEVRRRKHCLARHLTYSGAATVPTWSLADRERRHLRRARGYTGSLHGADGSPARCGGAAAQPQDPHGGRCRSRQRSAHCQ